MAKRFTAVGTAFLIVALSALLAFPAAATELDRGDARYNIAIVVDASGSLGPKETADPAGNRYGALSYFLGMLDTKGHELGAFVFNDQVKTVSEIQPINSEEAKELLLNAVKAEAPRGYTNIGEALLAAVNQLKGVQDRQETAGGSHLQSEVILFTDGVTQLTSPGAEQASFAARDQAITIAKANGIRISGVFLNDQGLNKDNQEVFDIVREVRSNASDPTAPGADDTLENDFYSYYAEIQSADDISTKFAKLALRFSVGGFVSPVPETVPLNKTVTIPGVGVSELNFGLRYKDGVKKKISVTIRNPQGEVTTENGGEGVTITKEEIFYNAKIQNPIAGLWEIHVGKASDVPVTEEVEVMSDIIISSNVSAKVEIQTADGKAKVGEPVIFKSYLAVDGNAVTDAVKYEGYTCTMTLVSNKTKQSKEYPMKLVDGHFALEVPVEEYEGYTARATYKCESIEFSSDEINVKPINQPPIPSGDPVKKRYDYTIFNDGIYKLALTDCVADPEGETELTFALVENGYNEDSVSVDGTGNITIDTGKQKGVGMIKIKVADPEGASSILVLELTTKSGNWKYIVILVAILLFVAGVLFCIKIFKDAGRIRSEFWAKIEEDGTQVAHGQGFLGGGAKFTLYELLTQSFAEWDGDEDRAKELISENKSTLGLYTFKAQKQGEFLFGRGKSIRARKETSFNETVNLDDDITLYIGTQKKDNDEDDNDVPDYDDNDDE